MRKTFSSLASLVAAAALPGGLPALAAGTVEVKYLEPEKFIDIGQGSHERGQNLSSLNQTFQSLARDLPDGQTLKIEVLDVDLAGETRLGTTRDLRVVRGGADWPSMTLRYTLADGNRTLKTGEAQLSDMAYLFAYRPSGRDGPLPFEQRMLQRWFSDTFTPTPP